MGDYVGNVTPHAKLKMIALSGGSGHMVKYHSRVVCSIFVTKNFAHVLRLNHNFYDVNSGSLHSQRDKSALSFRFAPFLPQNHPKRDVNRHFQAKHGKYTTFHIIKTTEAIPTKF